VSEAGYDPYTEVVAVKRGSMPAEVQRKFCAAMQEGWKRYMADPAKYNPRIAELLSYSVSTIRTDTMSIYRKLDVSGRPEAVARAVELGLVGTAPD
jgi:hypothetical protein